MWQELGMDLCRRHGGKCTEGCSPGHCTDAQRQCQRYKRTVDPGALVFAGSGSRSWESTYSNWTSNEWKYYWTKLPLWVKPSKSELAELAQTADSPEMGAVCPNLGAANLSSRLRG
jgi:hypothetical protein